MELSVISRDNYYFYFKKILAMPELSADEELELYQLYKNNDDKEALKKLVLSMLRYATLTTLKYQKTPFFIDLFQEAVKAIMVATEKFDITKKKRFSDYVKMWIKAYVYEYMMKNSTLLSYGSSTFDRKIWNNIEKTLEEITNEDDTLSKDEIMIRLSEKLDIPIDEIRNNYLVMNKLDKDDGFDSFTFRTPKAFNLEEVIDNTEEVIVDENKDKLIAALNSPLLTDKEKKVLQLRYYSDDEKIKTQPEIAKELGISKQAINVLEKKAIEKLKKQLVIDLN